MSAMSKKRILVILFTGILIVAVVMVVYQRLKLKQGLSKPPPIGKSLQMESVAMAADKLPKGFIVWSSNRFGNHDILKMDLPEQKITRLTTHPHTEYFPRISPDGRFIVFARSQRPWVSQRNQQLWDVILLDLESGKERLLAKNGNTPGWSADGKKVYFQKNVVHFTETDIETGEERDLLSSGRGQIKEGAVLYTPNYNAEKHEIAITLHIGDYTTAVVDKEGGLNKIARGCQIAWTRQGDALYYVGHGGKMNNAFYLYHPHTGKSTKWLDLPGDYSHEYFPKLSNDDNYLVFGASKGGHEHDSADYEVFLWQVGAPAASASRLTFHTGNDNWPDVYLSD